LWTIELVIYNEVTTDYNAGFQGLIVALKQLNGASLKIGGGFGRKSGKKAVLEEGMGIDHVEMDGRRRRRNVY